MKKPFHQHLQDDPNWSSFALQLELMGLEPPEFSDDRGPEHFANEGALSPDEDPKDAFPGAEGSIGRAEVMVDMLLDAALELAQIVNRYKLDELQRRRREIEAEDLAEPEERKRALESVTAIARIEEELGKNVRRSFPVWKVKGF